MGMYTRINASILLFDCSKYRDKLKPLFKTGLERYDELEWYTKINIRKVYWGHSILVSACIRNADNSNKEIAKWLSDIVEKIEGLQHQIIRSVVAQISTDCEGTMIGYFDGFDMHGDTYKMIWNIVDVQDCYKKRGVKV